jgi:hypothetical protein
MTGRGERQTQVRIDGLTGEQLRFVRETVFQALYSRAGSLAKLNEHPDPKASVREVAALGRLAETLQDDAVRVPDRAAAEAVLALARDVDGIHETEGVFEQYEQAVRERDAMRGLLAVFRGSPGKRDRRDRRGDTK